MRAVPASRYVVFFSIAVVGCAIDLITKRLMFERLGTPPFGRQEWIWPEVFGFQTSLNPGAVFGMGQGWAMLFAGLSVAAAVGVLYWLFFAGAARDWLLTVALGCVSAGIFGNLYDRLVLHAVRDWIQVMIGRWPWPTFNVADSLLVCGAAMLAWHAVRGTPKPASSTQQADSR